MVAGVRAFIGDRDIGIAASSWSFDEDATPENIADTSGGIGQMSITVKDYTGSKFEFDKTLMFTEPNRGSTATIIRDINRAKGRCEFTADSLLGLFNVSRKVGPVVPRPIENLVANPRPINLTGYTANPGTSGVATLSLSNLAALFGSLGALATWTTASTVVGGGIYYTSIAVQPGKDYTASGYVRLNKAQRMTLTLQWLDASGAAISVSTGAQVVVANTTNARLSATGTAPAGARSARLLFYSAAGTTGTTWAVGNLLYVSGVFASEGTTVYDYRDGDNANWAWLGAVRASTSRGLGYLATVMDSKTVEDAWRYYATDICGMPSTQVAIDPTIGAIKVGFVGWDGNVWQKMKELATVYRCEIALVWSTLLGLPQVTMRPIRTRTMGIRNASLGTAKVDKNGLARHVEVVNQRTEVKGAGVCWPEDPLRPKEGTILQVDTNETIIQRFKTRMSLVAVNQPQMAEKVTPIPYTDGSGSGVYTVMGNDNLPIKKAFWDAYGGSVSVRLTENPFEIEVILQGPTSKVNSPYRLAQSDGKNTYGGLYITGTGVFSDPETFVTDTGVTPSETSQDVGISIDSPFIDNKQKTYTAALQAADQYGLPSLALSGSVPRLNGGLNEFGFAAGSMIDSENARWRVSSTKFSTGGLGFDAKQSVTDADLNAIWGSLTDADFNLVYGSMTTKQFSVEPLRKP